MSVDSLSKSAANAVIKPSLLVYPFLALIYAYRFTLSPLIGQQCRFWPTCSHYAENALTQHGLWRGSWMTIKRLSRCHPWHPGGYDPVA